VQLEHGQWLPWLEQTGVSARTAQKYMRLARLYSDKNAAASHLTIDGALDSVAEHCEPLMIARLREAHVAYDGVLAALDHLEGIATNHDAERAVERLIEACNVAVKARCEAKVCFEAWVDDSCADEDPPTLRGRKRQLDLLDEATRLLDGLAQKMRSCVPDKLEALKVRLEGCVSEFGYQRD
jgi:hypothetical protein